MKVTPTRLPEVLLIEPKVHGDERGFFLETYHRSRYSEAGIDALFVQDNHSYSEGPILRGLHAQLRHPQGKLLRALEGEIFDVAVDIRRSSPRFGQWVGARLSGTNRHQLWIPPGFAHGFCVVSPTVHVQYKCTELYRAEDEISIRWDDETIGIDWPIDEPRLSSRDQQALSLEEALDRLPIYPDSAVR